MKTPCFKNPLFESRELTDKGIILYELVCLIFNVGLFFVNID